MVMARPAMGLQAARKRRKNALDANDAGISIIFILDTTISVVSAKAWIRKHGAMAEVSSFSAATAADLRQRGF